MKLREMRVAPILNAILLILALAPALSARATTLVVATVNNGHMLQMQRLSRVFEEVHPEIKIRWVTLEEHQLRQYVSSDIETRSGLVDIVTIGMYEVPLWARRGWLKPIQPQPGYDTDDLLDNIRDGLSYQGQLYAAPIYGESSMLMYRKDLMRKAGLEMPADPTWTEIAEFAQRLDDPANDIHGICLRGTPGWGENMTLITTMVNAQGGQWFDMRWQPQLESTPWREAASLYIELLSRFGPKDAASRGYNQNLALFQAGKCALWIDATVAAGFVSDPQQSKYASEVGFAPAPVGRTSKGARWLWAWALAIPADVDEQRAAAAQTFISWATSRDYVQLVAAKLGWQLVPSGTRKSTYADPEFQRTAPWAGIELEAIRTADPGDATLPESPYKGVQFAVIPEFITIGNRVGELIAQALKGQISVDEALAKGQYAAERQMRLGGYPNAAGTK